MVKVGGLGGGLFLAHNFESVVQGAHRKPCPRTGALHFGSRTSSTLMLVLLFFFSFFFPLCFFYYLVCAAREIIVCKWLFAKGKACKTCIKSIQVRINQVAETRNNNNNFNCTQR